MVRVVAVGDVGIHGSIAVLARTGRDALIEGTRRLLEGGDLVLGNLEIPMAPPGAEGSAPATGAAPPETAELLRAWGFTHLSLANNHIMDLGQAGLFYTIERFREAGLVPFGAGRDLEEALRPVRIDLDPPVGLLGYSMRCAGNAGTQRPGGAPFRFAEARRAIEELRSEGRAVVVSLHMGRMYLRRPSPDHLRVVRRLLEVGAHLVLCHHSHVPAGLITADGKVAALGLGEFVFDPRQGSIRTIVGRRSRRVGVLVRAEIDPARMVRAERNVLWQPEAGGPRAHPDSQRELRRWRRWDRELGWRRGPYALVYYAVEIPRLAVYIGHATFIYLSRGDWRRAYGSTLGLVLGRLRRPRS